MEASVRAGAGNDALSRIEDRLARIERLLSRQADQADDPARQRLDALVARMTQPEMLDRLELLVDQVEQAPQLVAMLGDMFDDFARSAEAQGILLDDVAKNLKVALLGAARNANALGAFFDSGMLSPHAVDLLAKMAAALSQAATQGVKPVGLFGALGAMREPGVQQAMGMLVAMGRTLGDALNGVEVKQLPAGNQG
ncbi:MAG: DUF1641 domain-containing protein [Polyangiaceae bacterium]